MAEFVILVRPSRFYGNAVTAATNEFQQLDATDEIRDDVLNAAALAEHGAARAALEAAGIRCLVVGWDSDEPDGLSKPDSIFPNNSFSIHILADEGNAHAPDKASVRVKLILYPMSVGRRREIPRRLLQHILTGLGGLAEVVDLREPAESSGLALEGTGALVFSPCGRFVYVSTSSRADAELARRVASELGIEACNVFVFLVTGDAGLPVYHTNVVMWTGQGICAVQVEGLAFADGDAGMKRFTAHLEQTYAKVIFLAPGEIRTFCGNCWEIQRLAGGCPVLCMSSAAWEGLSQDHKVAISEHYNGTHDARGDVGGNNICVIPIPTIERLGGGSVRCLMAAPILHRVSSSTVAEAGHLLNDMFNALETS